MPYKLYGIQVVWTYKFDERVEPAFRLGGRRHIHRIDYAALWTTLEEDVPHLVEQLRRWRGAT